MSSSPASVPAPATPKVATGTSANNGTHLVRALLETAEVRQAISAAVPEMLQAWAGDSRLRALLANALARVFAGSLTQSRYGLPEPSLRDVLRQPPHARQVAAQLPALINAFLGTSAAVSEGMALLPPGEKAGVLGEVLDKLDPALAGKMLTNALRFLNEAHATAPVPMAELLRPTVRAWLGSVDFGELKEIADTLSDQTPALVGMINEEMWEYPTKVVCLQAMLPAFVNAAVRALAANLEPVNRQAPDMVADLLLALVREVKGEEIGQLVNALCEVFRKAHTGSVLIGENGKPQMPADLAALVGEALGSMDIELLLKARALLADTKESTHNALLALLEEQPALVREMIASRFRRRAHGFRRLARETDLLERTLRDDEITTAVTSGLGEIDGQELADTLNRLLTIANQVHDASPQALRGVLTQVVGALDEGEARESVRWVVEDLVVALKPVASEVLPPVIKGLAELLASAADGNGEMRSAIDALRAALTPKEPTP